MTNDVLDVLQVGTIALLGFTLLVLIAFLIDATINDFREGESALEAGEQPRDDVPPPLTASSRAPADWRPLLDLIDDRPLRPYPYAVGDVRSSISSQPEDAA